jgi:hypothetical protein
MNVLLDSHRREHDPLSRHRRLAQTVIAIALYRRLKSYVAAAALALVSRVKSALHGGREFLAHVLELLGRVGADIVAGPRDVGPKL